MSRGSISGRTRVAGVIGAPVRHSLSPTIHNAWLAAAGIDGVYVPFSVAPDRFEAFVQANRSGGLAGVNVTLPFKARALAVADRVDASAEVAGAANLLVFEADGQVTARNTDGIGLLEAFAEQAPAWRAEDRPIVVLGAGGAARGAVAALSRSGADIRIVNRTVAHAQALAERFGSARAFALDAAEAVLAGAGVLVNATSAGLEGANPMALPLHVLARDAVVMDMVYTPLETALLAHARRLGLLTVDGLAMLIGQARPSFEALFGAPAPSEVDVRALLIAAQETTG